MKLKGLYKLSWAIGLIAFIGGWTIFLSWLIARYQFAYNLSSLEHLGFLWLYFFFIACSLALILIAIYAISNRKFTWGMLFCLLTLLSNMPSAWAILEWHSCEDDKVFVQIRNETDKEFDTIVLIEANVVKFIGELPNHSNEVIYYLPNTSSAEGRSYLEMDSLKLVLIQDKKVDANPFPIYYPGNCGRLYLKENSEFLEYEDGRQVRFSKN